MENISGFNLKLILTASNTYPIGLVLTKFADDIDAFDIPSLQIAETSMGLNGDLLVWNKANPIKLTLGMAPNTDQDIAMEILLNANRVGRGKLGANDVITLAGVFPDGRFIVFINGIITDGIPGNSVASAGRMKSKPYSFSFEGVQGI